MASSPAFTSTPRIGVASTSTANANVDGTGTMNDLLTGVTAGTRIEELVFAGAGDLADSVVNVFLYDGSDYRLFDSIDIGNPAAGSTTVGYYRVRRQYDNLVLPLNWKVAFTITVAPTTGTVVGWALGGDLT